MADYSGVIRFITSEETQAIVMQTADGSSYEDGYRFVKADFSAKAVDDTINYNYTGGTEDADTITII